MLPQTEELLKVLEPQPTGETTNLPDLSHIKLAYFDIYGTLLVSGVGDIGLTLDKSPATVLQKLWSDCFPGSPLPSLDLFETIRKLQVKAINNGADVPEIDIREAWHLLFESANQTVSEEFREQFAIAFECRINPVWEMPGAFRVLKHLKASKVILGIISNAQFYTPLLMEHCFQQSLDSLGFDPEFSFWSYEHLRGKPSRQLFNAAHQKALDQGIQPIEILMIGNDQRNDIMVPLELGWTTILFAGDKRSLRWRKDDPECAKIRPQGILAHWSDWTLP